MSKANAIKIILKQLFLLKFFKLNLSYIILLNVLKISSLLPKCNIMCYKNVVKLQLFFNKKN